MTPRVPILLLVLLLLSPILALGAPPGGYVVKPWEFESVRPGGPIGWVGHIYGILLFHTEAMQAEFAAPPEAEVAVLGLRALNGDHLNAPQMEVIVNGVSLGTGNGWHRIRYEKGEPWPTARAYIPRPLLQEQNQIEVVNRGPDWWVFRDMSVEFISQAELEKLVAGVPTQDRALRPPHWAEGPKLDGQLTEPSWATAAHIKLGGGEAEPLVEVRVAYGDNALYVGFEVADPTYPIDDPEAHWRMGRFWDLAEVVLSLRPNERFEFWVAPDGRHIARRIVGGEMDLDYQPRWEAVAIAEEGHWQAELRIPFAVLGVEDSEFQFVPAAKAWLLVGQDWRANLIYRRRRSSREGGNGFELWAWQGFREDNTRYVVGDKLDLPLAEFYRPENMGLLQGLRGDFREQAWSPLTSVNLGVGEWGQNVAEVRLKPTAENLTAHLRIVPLGDQASPVRQQPLPAAARVAHWAYFLSAPGAYRAEVYLLDAASGKLVYRQQQRLVAEPPLEVRWHRSYYTSEPRAILRARPWLQWDEELPLQARLRLVGDGGLSQAYEFQVLPKVGGEVAVDLADLPNGTYEARLTLQTPAGDQMALPAPDLVKLPPAPHEIKLRDDGFLLVDGELRFAFATAENFEENTGFQGGFNCTVLWDQYKEPQREEWYHNAAQYGPYALDVVFPYEAIGGVEVDYPALKTHVTRLSQYDACLGYYLMDEPEYLHNENMHPTELLRVNRYIKHLDPYHLTVISQGLSDPAYNCDQAPNYFDVTDVVVVQAYGTPASCWSKLTWAREVMRRHPAVMWAYLGVIRPGQYTTPQLQANVYDALIVGARGIVLFHGRDLIRSPELWPEFTQKLSEQIELLTPILAEGESWPVDTPTEGLAAAAYHYRSQIYLLLVNNNEHPVTGRLVLPMEGEAQVKELFGEHKLYPRPVANGLSLTMPLEKWAVRVYEITAAE